MTHSEADVRPGGQLLIGMVAAGGAVAAEATFREVMPPRDGPGRLVHDGIWTEGPADTAPLGVPSVVTFDLTPDAGGAG